MTSRSFPTSAGRTRWLKIAAAFWLLLVSMPWPSSTAWACRA
jgi:hypothetical protein